MVLGESILQGNRLLRWQILQDVCKAKEIPSDQDIRSFLWSQTRRFRSSWMTPNISSELLPSLEHFSLTHEILFSATSTCCLGTEECPLISTTGWMTCYVMFLENYRISLQQQRHVTPTQQHFQSVAWDEPISATRAGRAFQQSDIWDQMLLHLIRNKRYWQSSQYYTPLEKKTRTKHEYLHLVQMSGLLRENLSIWWSL